MLVIKEIISFLYWIAIIVIGSKIFKNNLEYNRKFVHIMIANWWFMAIAFFDNFVHASIVPIIFVFINSYATFSKSQRFVAGLKREKTDLSLGLISYPIGYLIALYLAYNQCANLYYAGIGIMTLGYGDGFAALIGKKYNYRPYYIGQNKKTLSGTMAMFVCTFISVLLYCAFFGMEPAIYIALLTAIVGSIVEAVAVKGTDNMLIPLIVILIYMIVW